MSPSKSAVLVNGGVLTVNLYKITTRFVEYCTAYNKVNDTSDSGKINLDTSAPMIMNWTEPKGEILVI